MNPWFDSIVALVGCVLVSFACRRVARWPTPWWAFAYFAPLIVVVAYGVFVRRPDWALHPVWSWILVGSWRYPLIGMAVAGVLSTLIAKLPKSGDRRAVTALTVVTLVYVTFWPTLAAAFNQTYLKSLRTHIDASGVCRQHTDYTCGPAAAVTGLLRLGIRADEGKLALQARTSEATGTPADVLTETLNREFREQGLRASLRRIDTLDELRHAGLTLVILHYSWVLDHWMCVLRVTEDGVIVGDPMSGRIKIPKAEFLRRYRRVGVVLSRVEVATE